MSADKVSDVNELIEEQPLEKDAFSITNETSSLAFLYDDVPADADSEILTKEQLGKLETEIPLDSTWAEIWEKPSDTAEPEASESAELSDTSELQDQPETAEDQSKTAEQPSVIIEKQPELFEEPETAEKQQDIFVQSDTVEQPEVYEQSAEEPAQLPEESDVKIFEKKKRTEAKIENTAEKADDDKEVTTSSHVILKIIAVLLVLCALFEGATLVLANVAPDAGITQNLLGIEESVVGSISSFFSGIFGGGK